MVKFSEYAWVLAMLVWAAFLIMDNMNMAAHAWRYLYSLARCSCHDSSYPHGMMHNAHTLQHSHASEIGKDDAPSRKMDQSVGACPRSKS